MYSGTFPMAAGAPAGSQREETRRSFAPPPPQSAGMQYYPRSGVREYRQDGGNYNNIPHEQPGLFSGFNYPGPTPPAFQPNPTPYVFQPQRSEPEEPFVPVNPFTRSSRPWRRERAAQDQPQEDVDGGASRRRPENGYSAYPRPVFEPNDRARQQLDRFGGVPYVGQPPQIPGYIYPGPVVPFIPSSAPVPFISSSASVPFIPPPAEQAEDQSAPYAWGSQERPAATAQPGVIPVPHSGSPVYSPPSRDSYAEPVIDHSHMYERRYRDHARSRSRSPMARSRRSHSPSTRGSPARRRGPRRSSKIAYRDSAAEPMIVPRMYEHRYHARSRSRSPSCSRSSIRRGRMQMDAPVESRSHDGAAGHDEAALRRLEEEVDLHEQREEQSEVDAWMQVKIDRRSRLLAARARSRTTSSHMHFEDDDDRDTEDGLYGPAVDQHRSRRSNHSSRSRGRSRRPRSRLPQPAGPLPDGPYTPPPRPSSPTHSRSPRHRSRSRSKSPVVVYLDSPDAVPVGSSSPSPSRSSRRLPLSRSKSPGPVPLGPLASSWRSSEQYHSMSRDESSIPSEASAISSVASGSLSSSLHSRERFPRPHREPRLRSASRRNSDNWEFVKDEASLAASSSPGPVSIVMAPQPTAMPMGQVPVVKWKLPSVLTQSPHDTVFPETLPLPVTSPSLSSHKLSTFTLDAVLMVVAFVLLDFIPRQAYLHILLRIPSLYFSRVTRIFEDARLSLPDIKRMARAKAEQWDEKEYPMPSVMFRTPDQAQLPRSLLILRASWESFIDSLMREWKTFNVISVLLMSAILTLLQIDAASHPITRTTALFSLICSLMSLLYGCIYIIRFGTMRKMHKASSFAQEARSRTTSIWWNVWVLLAMPAIWLSWAILTFLASIMSFIWLSGSTQDSTDILLSPRAALGPRIGLTCVFVLGLLYFGLIVREFHRYGDPLDREWMRAMNEWAKEHPSANIPPVPSGAVPPPPRTLSPHLRAMNAQPSPPYQHQSTFLAPRRPRAWYNWPKPSSLNRSPARSPSPTWGPSPARSPPPEADARNYKRLPPSQPLTTRPSAFFKTPGPPPAQYLPNLLYQPPLPVMYLERHVHALDYADTPPWWWSHMVPGEDWSRFTLDISGAWNGQLSLAKPDAAASLSDSALPVYTLLEPTRAESPLSKPSVYVFGTTRVPAAKTRSITSSDTSYGDVKASGFVRARARAIDSDDADDAADEKAQEDVSFKHVEDTPRNLSPGLSPSASLAPSPGGNDLTEMYRAESPLSKPSSETSYGDVKASGSVGARAIDSDDADDAADDKAQQDASLKHVEDTPRNASPGPSPLASLVPSPGGNDPTVSAEPDRAQTVQQFLDLWNERYFHARGLEARMTRREPSVRSGASHPSPPRCSITLFLRQPPGVDERFVTRCSR